MALNLRHEGGDADVVLEINTTPLIDVMLVLLIMLIITIPIQTHAVKLDMPSVPATVMAPPPPVVRIDIDFDGTIFWNGQLLPDRDALESRLRSVAAQSDPPEIHVRPNKLVAYHSVSTVLSAAQRLGVTRIGIVGNEQFL